jgi:hypothetical protein
LLAAYGRGREIHPETWAPGAGGANGATGYLIDEVVGYYLRTSEDRKAGLETSISEEPENLAEEAERDLGFETNV